MTLPAAKLGDFCEIVQGGRLKLSGEDFIPDGYPAYGAGGLNGYLPVAEFHRPGIILSSIGARCGKCFLAEDEWTTLANTQVILPDLSRADVRFLWYQLNDESRWHRSGTAQPFIKPSDVKGHVIALPPLPEQRRIAAILDQADELRAKRQSSLAQLHALRDSYVAQALRTLDQREPLGDHLVFVTSGSRGWAKFYASSGSRFIRSQDVLLGSIDESDPAFVDAPSNSESRRTAIRAGDLLITITGSVGRVTAAPAYLDGAFISQHVAIGRPGPTLHPLFAEAYLCSPEGQRQLKRAQYGQTKPGLNLTQIRDLTLPVPDLATQDALIERLRYIDCCRDRLRNSQLAMQSLLLSLQHRAFRGEL